MSQVALIGSSVFFLPLFISIGSHAEEANNQYKPNPAAAAVSWTIYDNRHDFKQHKKNITSFYCSRHFKVPKNNFFQVKNAAADLERPPENTQIPSEDEDNFESKIILALNKIKSENKPRLYIDFSSHGVRGSLCQRNSSKLGYEKIMDVIFRNIEYYQSLYPHLEDLEVIIINSACYSGSAKSFFLSRLEAPSTYKGETYTNGDGRKYRHKACLINDANEYSVSFGNAMDSMNECAREVFRKNGFHFGSLLHNTLFNLAEEVQYSDNDFFEQYSGEICSFDVISTIEAQWNTHNVVCTYTPTPDKLPKDKLIEYLKNSVSDHIKVGALHELEKLELKDNDWDVISAAMQALKMTSFSTRDPYRSMRYSASLLLDKIGNKATATETVPILINALKEEPTEEENPLYPSYPMARVVAVIALAKMGKKATREAAREAADELMWVALQDPEREVRISATHALIEMGKKAVPTLIVAMENSDSKVRLFVMNTLIKIGKEAAEAVPALMVVLQQEKRDSTFRYYAITVLASMEEKAAKAVPMLIAAMKDPDPKERSVVIEGLIKAGGKAETVLLAALKEPEIRMSAVNAFIEIGGEAIPALMVALQDPDPMIRISAAQALGHIGEEAAETKPALVVVAQKDPDSMVRYFAIDALKRIKAFLLSP
ncbi:MAG: HEAT repeat domain-containing protein [Gammaproteobacteria bacterium]|nr:HEAT repeat domain-containing protein [Gammaproteobacteria bacterium]